MGGNEASKKFQKIDQINNKIPNEDDEYKPQYLNPTDIQVDLENSPEKQMDSSKFVMSARSNDDLVPDENNKIGSTK